MTENEKRLREWIHNRTVQRDAEKMLDALLAEHRAEASVARDAALVDAAERVRRDPREFSRDDHATSILALRSQPAQTIPVAKVREALDHNEEKARAPSYMSADEASAFENGWAAAIRCVEDRLGVPLDAETRCPAPEGERCVCFRSLNIRGECVYCCKVPLSCMCRHTEEQT